MGHALGRCAVLAMVLSAMLSFGPAVTAAQDALDAHEEEASLQLELQDAHYLRGVGMGLTLGGLITAGGGTGSLFVGDLSGAIAGGTFAGLGGVVGLAGIPMWIVGGALIPSARSSRCSPAPRSGPRPPASDPRRGRRASCSQARHAWYPSARVPPSSIGTLVFAGGLAAMSLLSSCSGPPIDRHAAYARIQVAEADAAHAGHELASVSGDTYAERCQIVCDASDAIAAEAAALEEPDATTRAATAGRACDACRSEPAE